MITTLISFLGGSVFRMLDGAAGLAQAFCADIRSGRFAQRLKQPEVSAFSIITLAFRHIFSCSHVEADSKSPRLIVRPSDPKVLQICFVVNATKVFKRVVRPVSVKMINAFGRPLASYKKYRASVGVILPTCYGDFDVAVRLNPTSYISRLCGSVAYSARKYACVQVIVQKFSQSLGGKIGISHGDSLIVRLVRSRVRFAVVHGFAHFTGGVPCLVR
jgi:hypothetical protein